jgi:hypothetical protein
MSDDADPGSDSHSDPGTDEEVAVTVEIADGRSIVEVAGDRDAVVVVRSAAGEQIYLPPEDFDRPPESRSQSRQDSPYQSPSANANVDAGSGGGGDGGGTEHPDSPYQSVAGDPDSPYQSAAEAPSDSPYQPTVDPATTTGLEPTADGFRILHPEPVTDFRLLR